MNLLTEGWNVCALCGTRGYYHIDNIIDNTTGKKSLRYGFTVVDMTKEKEVFCIEVERQRMVKLLSG